MANTLTNVTPQLLAQGLMALRKATILPRLVNTDYSNVAAAKGSTIDVPIPSAISATAVTAAITPPANTDVSPTTVAIALDKWYEAAFYLTDKELGQVIAGHIPMQASEAVKALAEQLNSDLFAEYKGVYGYVGTAATTPFASDTTAATAARKTLNTQLAPLSPRFTVLDPDAEANALDLRAFQDASFRGDAAGIVEGQIGRKLGFDFFMDQQVPTHTTTAAGTITVDDAAHAAGASTITWDGGGTAPAAGDVFTAAGDTQTYTVVSSTATVITHSPVGQVALADDAALTFKASHVVNLAAHRDAFALAIRPLEAPGDGLGNIIESAVDPVSGLALRLEVSRQHKQTRWSFDILYGVKLVRAALACRVAG